MTTIATVGNAVVLVVAFVLCFAVFMGVLFVGFWMGAKQSCHSLVTPREEGAIPVEAVIPASWGDDPYERARQAPTADEIRATMPGEGKL